MMCEEKMNEDRVKGKGRENMECEKKAKEMGMTSLKRKARMNWRKR